MSKLTLFSPVNGDFSVNSNGELYHLCVGCGKVIDMKFYTVSFHSNLPTVGSPITCPHCSEKYTIKASLCYQA